MRKSFRKLFVATALVMTTVMVLTAAGCGSSDGDSDGDGSSSSSGVTGTINVKSREESSGTRGAFEELFEIEDLVSSSEITNSTSVMMTSVQSDTKAIGYVSLGSLDTSMVKAVKIDGVEATAANVKNGSYTVSRPFNIATLGDPTDLAQDFINYILSDEGQAIVEDNGYVSEGSNGAYESAGVTGEITVGGSSSVTPLMEKLEEAYMELNDGVTVNVQQSDSSTGMSSTAEGVYDIGTASRDLKDSETELGLVGQTIALDGVAVIVNLENDIDNLTTEQVNQIYTGEITTWDDLAE